MKYIKRGMAAIACIMLLLSMTIPAMAADTTVDFARKGSIRITLKDSAEPHAIIKGASFHLYQVGTAFSENGTLRFSLTDDFSGSNISLRDLRADGLAAHLCAYAEQQGISGMRATADADGHVLFENLQTGLYLAVQDGSIAGYYATESFLLSVPMADTDGAGWLYDIQASPKAEAKPNSPSSGTTSLTVEKQWNHSGHAAPESVTVALLRDGKLYDKQVLNAENQWSHKWTKLDKDYSWTAIELDIPDGYQVSYSSVGKKVVITNTYVPTLPENPESLTVIKKWDTNGKIHPDSVKVELWNGTELYTTAILSDSNNWSATWTQLPRDGRWTVYEVDVPNQYEATYSAEGTTITILNTDKTNPPESTPTPSPTTPDDPSAPEGPTLIQTGQLNWPVPVLTAAGILLFVVGWLIYHRGRKCNEK